MSEFTSLHIEKAFDGAFFTDYRTVLRGGFCEPFYRAVNAHGNAQIEYRLDYISSALHEVAHWCVAGPERRKQDDFGYWYTPDDRDLPTQQAFELVEVRPQAYECLFAWSLKRPFRVSTDNLALRDYDYSPFQDKVLAEVGGILSAGIPIRVMRFCEALWALSPQNNSDLPDNSDLLAWFTEQYENSCR